MADNPIPNSLPTRWQPGQSGNPRGYSEKRRKAKRLRRALDAILEQQAPEDWLFSVPERIAQIIPPDVTMAELIAVRAVLIAGTATDDGAALAAIRVILQATGTPDGAAPPERRGAPVLAASDERRRQVAQQLGIDLEDEEKP